MISNESLSEKGIYKLVFTTDDYSAFHRVNDEIIKEVSLHRLWRGVSVFRRCAIGADGNQGMEIERVARFGTEKEAADFIERQTDKNGWVDYVVERSEE